MSNKKGIVSDLTQHQIISKIVSEGDKEFVLRYGLSKNYFTAPYDEQIEFITTHITEHDKVPDLSTFAANFEKFQFIEVKETDSYLITKLEEGYTWQRARDLIQNIGNEIGDLEGPEALSKIEAAVREVKDSVLTKSTGIDIIQDRERLDNFKNNTEKGTSTGLKTGFTELDKDLGEFLDDDIIVLAARTNQGKSWLGLAIGKNCWKQGANVLHYSGEMNHRDVGYRFDTLHGGMGNWELVYGGADISEYEKFLEELKTSENFYNVVTPRDFGRRLDIPQLRTLIERQKPDLIVIDQLSLMDDYRQQGRNAERIKYTHIMEDLRALSSIYLIPIVVLAQTNRKSAEKTDGDIKPAELTELAESGGVETSATRAITFAVNAGILELCIKKNRIGPRDTSCKLVWDINTGKFQSFTGGDKDVYEKEKVESGSEETVW